LYAGGNFTLAGGVASTAYIARWNGSVWSALGTGMNGAVYAIEIGSDGSLYAGGNFTLAGGVASTAYIARWNGSVWSALGTGMNGAVYAIEVGSDGSLYAGGNFTLAGGVANTVYCARWSGSAWVALGTGMNNNVRAISLLPSGSLCFGGDFTTAGGVSVNHIASWNGFSWSALGAGTGGSVNSADVFGGLLVVGGTFTTVSGFSADRLAGWNGYSWVQYSLDLPGTVLDYIGTIIFERTGSVYIGYGASGSATTSYQNTITPTATAAINPKVKITCSAGSPVVNYLKNDTTGATIWINYTMQVGETLTIELDPLKLAATSSYYGDVTGRCILRGSNMANFELLPAENKVSFFVNGGTVEATMTWPVRHWSLDGVVL
jgi:hypothetical protein